MALNNNFLNYGYSHNMSNIRPTCPLNLRQIDTWDTPKELYINGIKWTLRKDYRDSSMSIPNIMNIQFDDVNSGYMKIDEFSSKDKNIYMFLYYGTILPKVGSYEKPMNVFFQWFNDKPVQLRKDLISEADWNRANVYVSDYGSLQLATKNALFKAIEDKSNAEQVDILPNIQIARSSNQITTEVNENVATEKDLDNLRIDYGITKDRN